MQFSVQDTEFRKLVTYCILKRKQFQADRNTITSSVHFQTIDSCMIKSGIRIKLHHVQQLKIVAKRIQDIHFVLLIIFTFSDTAAANLPSMCLPHLQLCSAVFSQYSGALLKPFSQACLMKTNASVRTSRALFSSPISPASLSRAAPVLSIFLHLHILMPRLLSCSLSCCVGFIHLAGLRTLVTASLHVCVCVVVCQLICACVG